MSLTVRHLNADATFLLTFEPQLARSSSSSAASSTPLHPPDGSFTILCDPWLSGPSQIIHPIFSIQDHTVPACISSLDEIPEPDLVLISQSKPDHCHESTLRQLRGHGSKTVILAEPNAARRIRSWKHFDPDKVQSMRRFQEQDGRAANVRRIRIPPTVPFGNPGEVTIALITKKYDLAGLHTAFGITYRPPTPWSPYGGLHPQPSLPDSPNSYHSFQSSTTLSSYSSPGDRALSILFSPHGISYSDIQPYAQAHLVSEAALPLSAFFHPFDRVQNPWWLGGNISTGLPGGLEIAQSLLARYWIQTHDEEKMLGGFSVLNMRTEKYRPEVVQQLMARHKGQLGTEARVLDVGEYLHVPSWGAEI
ncbi:MAG: hypothetical protein M4579_001443 [Chaenotheca gracillima]|nr:MAG: hypothetical protein M4579_001443 [Chaenotheca gracillima]